MRTIAISVLASLAVYVWRAAAREDRANAQLRRAVDAARAREIRERRMRLN